MITQTNIWPKHITVDKRIVQILSGSTYANFPSAIREIITNSYDADAQNVHLDIDIKKEIITIRDDGKGMNENDFEFFLRLAGKSRKTETQTTKAKRRIVGQFGVGFLSALPFCDKYLIETKKKGSDEIVQATIVSSEYFNNELDKKNVDEISIFGGIKKDPKLYHEQYTRIRLVGFSKLSKSFFKEEYKVKNRRSTINNYSPLALFKWQLCEYLPLEYDTNSVIGKKLNSIFNYSSPIPFNVYFNKERITRNIHAKHILESSTEEMQEGNIRFRYVILTDYSPIDPAEARYLMLRNLNVGVGPRTTFDLGLDGKVYGKLAHLTGEVDVTQGLNDLINVARDKFNFSPDYERLKEFLRQKLSKWANELDKLKSEAKTKVELIDESKVTNLESLKSGKKKLHIFNKKYSLIVEKWNANSSEFPAIKIENSKIFINQSYSPFTNKNIFDSVLKFHILLILKFEKDKHLKASYKSINQDILKVF